MAFGDSLLEGQFSIGEEKIYYASGVNIVRFPAGGYLHAAVIADKAHVGMPLNPRFLLRIYQMSGKNLQSNPVESWLCRGESMLRENLVGRTRYQIACRCLYRRGVSAVTETDSEAQSQFVFLQDTLYIIHDNGNLPKEFTRL